MAYVLAIALLTWGGVFAYLLRIEQLTKKLEREVEAARRDAERDAERDTEHIVEHNIQSESSVREAFR